MPYKDPEKRREAAKLSARKWRLRNPTASRDACARYREANREKERLRSAQPANKANRRAYQVKRYRADPIAVRAYAAEWATKNPEKALAIKRRCYQKLLEKGAYSAQTAKRRATKARATPSWADLSMIKKIYRTARDLKMHVDHIVPLHSRIVCGLHWENNLQLMDPKVNLKKSNLVWPDMPHSHS